MQVRGSKPLIGQDSSGDGAAVTTLSGPALREDARGPAAMIAHSPGASAVQTGAAALPLLLSLRGGTAEQLAVYLDGAPLPTVDGGLIDLNDLPVHALRRIDIYRGHVPAELGAPSMGGAVHVQTRDDGGAALRAGAGSFGTDAIDGSAAVGGERWSAHAAASWTGTRGNFPFRLDPGTVFAASDDRWEIRRNNAANRESALVGASAELGDKWRWRGFWLGSALDAGIAGAAAVPALSAQFSRRTQALMQRLQGQGVAAAGDTFSLTVALQERWSQADDRMGELGRARVTDRRTLAATATTLWVGPANALGGIQHGPLAEIRAVAAQSQAWERLEPAASAPAARTAGGATVGWRVTGRENAWQLTPSVAADVAADRAVAPASGAVPAAQWQSSSALWQGAVAGRWQFADGWSASAAARRAARMANLQELYADSGAVAGNPRLAPETGYAAELGILRKIDRAAWRAAVDVRGFAAQHTDLIQLVVIGPSKATYLNVGRALLAGGELAAAAQWAPWQFNGQFSLLHAVDAQSSPPRRLPLRPPAQASATLQRRIGAANSWCHLQIWGSANWQDATFVDAANTQQQPARTLLSAGLRAQFAGSRATLELRADNLANAAWFDLVGYPLPGRSVWMQIGWQAMEDRP